MGKHVGLAIKKNGFLSRVKVLESKFDRKAGDKMRIDNVEYIVVVAEENASSAMTEMNSIIKKNNLYAKKRDLAGAQVFWNSLGF